MISVIIPVYNSSQTLKKCLDAVFDNNFENFEVIVVSDNSLDNSVDISKNYNFKIIELEKNRGPAFARNTGANSASGDILLFIDSDVIIKNNAMLHVDKIIKSDEKKIVQGIYSHEPNYKNMATQYQQSFYCYFTFNTKDNYSDTLISMCFAIKKNIFQKLNGFNTKIRKATAEDEEFGYVLIERGYKIFITKELNVEHKVNYSLVKFIERNFCMYTDTMMSYLRNKTAMKKARQKNYSNVIIRIPFLLLIIIMIFVIINYPNKQNFNLFLILNVIFLFLHLGFINFVKKAKGLLNAFKIIIICYLDTFLMLLGSFYGSFLYLFSRKY